MDTLVSVSELATNLHHPDWLILDCRFSLVDAAAGEAAYHQAHIPGARYINLETDLSAARIPGKTGRHPLPEKALWIHTVQQLGITPSTQVVTYDDGGGAMAARVWWMLRWIGHENVAVLNGGWQAWETAGQEVTADIPAPRPPVNTDYAALSSLVRSVSADEVNGQTNLLLDAREVPRYRGDVEPLDPVAGHIPGAVCSPFSGNLDTDGLFLSPDALKGKFAVAAADDRPVICYCGSGVTAAHNILAMKIAGLEEPALYPGSWSEWITDPSRPVARGDKEDEGAD